MPIIRLNHLAEIEVSSRHPIQASESQLHRYMVWYMCGRATGRSVEEGRNWDGIWEWEWKKPCPQRDWEASGTGGCYRRSATLGERVVIEFIMGWAGWEWEAPNPRWVSRPIPIPSHPQWELPSHCLS